MGEVYLAKENNNEEKYSDFLEVDCLLHFKRENEKKTRKLINVFDKKNTCISGTKTQKMKQNNL